MAVADDAAPFEHNDAFIEAVDEVFFMGDDQDGSTQGVNSFQQAHNFEGASRVEITGRLIGDNSRGVIEEGACDSDALLFAAGEFGGEAAAFIFEADEVKAVRDSFFNFPGASADGAHSEDHIIIDRFMFNEPEVLEDDADGSPQVWDLPFFNISKGEAVDHNAALRGFDFTDQEFNNGRLTAAGRADHKDEFAVLDFHRESVQGVGTIRVFFHNID